jgi:hypothetical protein
MSPQMKKMLIYVDASVVAGCEDLEFAEDSLALWLPPDRNPFSKGAIGQ